MNCLVPSQIRKEPSGLALRRRYVDEFHAPFLEFASAMKTDRVIEILKSMTFLGRLPDNLLAQLVRQGQIKSYRIDDVLCSRGDAGHSAMLVLSGRLKVSNTTFDGKEITLNYLGVGHLDFGFAGGSVDEMLGEMQRFRREVLPNI